MPEMTARGLRFHVQTLNATQDECRVPVPAANVLEGASA
jgi:hypothetical protein